MRNGMMSFVGTVAVTVVGIGVIAGVMAVGGCRHKSESELTQPAGPAERAGAKLDKAAEKTGEAVKTAAEATKDAAGKVVEKTGEGLGKAGAAMEKKGEEIQK